MRIVEVNEQLYASDDHSAHPTCRECAFVESCSVCSTCQGTPYRRVANAKSAIERYGNIEQPRVYLSGAITGFTRKEYLAKFAAVERKFRENGFAVLNPAAACDELPQLSHAEYMNVAIEMLKMARYIYVIDGEQTSKGVKLELDFSEKHGIKRIDKI